MQQGHRLECIDIINFSILNDLFCRIFLIGLIFCPHLPLHLTLLWALVSPHYCSSYLFSQTFLSLSSSLTLFSSLNKREHGPWRHCHPPYEVSHPCLHLCHIIFQWILVLQFQSWGPSWHQARILTAWWAFPLDCLTFTSNSVWININESYFPPIARILFSSALHLWRHPHHHHSKLSHLWFSQLSIQFHSLSIARTQ